MTDHENIVDLDSRRPPSNPGNGAREALIEIWSSFYCATGDACREVDIFLIELWMRGFKVVPADGEKARED